MTFLACARMRARPIRSWPPGGCASRRRAPPSVQACSKAAARSGGGVGRGGASPASPPVQARRRQVRSTAVDFRVGNSSNERGSVARSRPLSSFLSSLFFGADHVSRADLGCHPRRDEGEGRVHRLSYVLRRQLRAPARHGRCRSHAGRGFARDGAPRAPHDRTGHPRADGLSRGLRVAWTRVGRCLSSICPFSPARRPSAQSTRPGG